MTKFYHGDPLQARAKRENELGTLLLRNYFLVRLQVSLASTPGVQLGARLSMAKKRIRRLRRRLFQFVRCTR